MHLSEGVLHLPVLLSGAAVAIIGIALGLHQLPHEKLPLTALFSAAFFVASTIHIPIGIGSVHLILNGLAGLFLGWAVFPAFLIALMLQVLFFSFSGFAVLGVNLCIMALPAVLVRYLFRRFVFQHSSSKLGIIGFCSGAIGVLGAALIASAVLALDGGKNYYDLIALLFVTHLPVLLIDSLISSSILLMLAKMYPLALRSANYSE
ncbi:cobalamin biosynthesis protein CbiM [Actinobacillus seminis]|uniref:Cobalamin biosynthesis protein CbiM n=1 Tax=Actinobacillus seminis TaxID=722 RepID=A0A263HEH6_9PAST|nr:cobalt transporter CbiM [Actinobacillus seminis]OZN25358.1 cobalamin biosynthesis protein CbiM [Actinobacillus seminis]SUU35667.1 cobalt transport protein CbiM [Actinobacillus seminis]